MSAKVIQAAHRFRRDKKPSEEARTFLQMMRTLTQDNTTYGGLLSDSELYDKLNLSVREVRRRKRLRNDYFGTGPLP